MDSFRFAHTLLSMLPDSSNNKVCMLQNKDHVLQHPILLTFFSYSSSSSFFSRFIKPSKCSTSRKLERVQLTGIQRCHVGCKPHLFHYVVYWLAYSVAEIWNLLICPNIVDVNRVPCACNPKMGQFPFNITNHQ